DRGRPPGKSLEPDGRRSIVGRDARRAGDSPQSDRLRRRIGTDGHDRRADRTDRLRRPRRAASRAHADRRRSSRADAVCLSRRRHPARGLRCDRADRHGAVGSPGRRRDGHPRRALSRMDSASARDVTTRSLFVGGTSSNAGKSWVATAICASLRRRGVRVAPFKAQNMSNHSYPCRDGGEIGRAQVAQAQACGLEPETAMNPILLKPNGDGTSQVVVRGRVWKTLTAREYYEQFDVLLAEVVAAYEDLAARYDAIVIEGAGSVSELNLRQHDLVNLGLVTRVRSPWVLVADIERGGVFASVIGTVSLLTPEERSLFRGFLINRFRGDRSLFESGAALLEQKTGAPCLGVFPYAGDTTLEAKDILAIQTPPPGARPPAASIAIVRLPCLSNATDFRLLTWADWIDARPAADYDFVILPGSKQTIRDLAWLRSRGLDSWIFEQQRRGATIIGVCGGYQMLGRELIDPHGVESAERSAEGLGLLPVNTVIEHTKTTRVRRARTAGGVEFDAYEIHLGATTAPPHIASAPFAVLDDGSCDGMRSGRIIGTYLHGSFENANVCSEVFGVPMADRARDDYLKLADWLERDYREPERWLP